jgi:hypothetical protein
LLGYPLMSLIRLLLIHSQELWCLDLPGFLGHYLWVCYPLEASWLPSNVLVSYMLAEPWILQVIAPFPDRCAASLLFANRTRSNICIC